MALKLSVPSLTPESVKNLKDTILTSEPEASVDIDVESKTVTIASKASEETFRQLITATGHTVS